MAGARLQNSTAARGVYTACVLVLGAVLIAGIAAGTPAATDAGAATSIDRAAASTATMQSENVTEDAYVEPVPELGDEYYEAADPDGNWISYINPRDRYRSPYLGDGSGKICVTLLNEDGEPIVGETVPNTSVTVPTGEELEWHTDADPMVVNYPLTDHYERPLDADQFGTSSDLPQGGGYLDSHCIEMHGQPEDATIEYGEAEIEGEHADDIELVGYIQQANMAGWDTDIDPIENATDYEEAGGEWTYRTDASHGQVVVVLQLDRDGEAAALESGETEQTDDPASVTDDGDQTDTTDTDDSDQTDATDTDDSDELPGFGIGAAIAALVALIVATRR